LKWPWVISEASLHPQAFRLMDVFSPQTLEHGAYQKPPNPPSGTQFKLNESRGLGSFNCPLLGSLALAFSWVYLIPVSNFKIRQELANSNKKLQWRKTGAVSFPFWLTFFPPYGLGQGAYANVYGPCK
jgi:hypothetical protein